MKSGKMSGIIAMNDPSSAGPRGIFYHLLWVAVGVAFAVVIYLMLRPVSDPPHINVSIEVARSVDSVKDACIGILERLVWR